MAIQRKREENQISTAFKLSCGHPYYMDELTENVTVRDFIKAENFDPEGKLLEKFNTKIGGKTKRPAEEIITIDREAEEVRHIVKEQNERGEWELVWNKPTPFSELAEKERLRKKKSA